MQRSTHSARVAETVGCVLKRELLAQGLTRRLERRMPMQVWREAVGEGIAERAQPTALTGGVLYVLVQDHRWRDQLDAARVLIIAKVNARLGAPLVRELRFGLAHEGALTRTPVQAAARPVGAAASAHVPEAAQLGPELRAAFLGAADAALRAARARSRGA